LSGGASLGNLCRRPGATGEALPCGCSTERLMKRFARKSPARSGASDCPSCGRSRPPLGRKEVEIDTQALLEGTARRCRPSSFHAGGNEKTPRRSGVSCPLCRHRRTAGVHADAIAGFQPRLRPGASGSPLSCAARRRACEERLGPRPFARHARGGRRTAPFGRTGRADTALA
jgi:hypothetical protein